MKTSSYIILALVLCLLIAPVAIASSPAGLGSPTLRVIPGANSQSAVIVADGITNGGTVGNGAISWDVFIVLPTTVGINDFTVTAGSAWTALCPGFFTVTKVSQGQFLGGNAYLLSGFCTQVPSGAVTGSDVTIATLNFTSSCSVTGAFDVNLSTGPQNDSTDLFDSQNELYLFTEASLTDGGSICGPTAVTMSGMEATSNNPVPFTAAAWPVLAGMGAVAAGGVYALARRKR
ncbi:MAG: hypothetical protein WAZ19_02615 [Anaerolineae bacterium]